MTSMSVLPLIFTSSWASGINAYAVVLLMGLMGATGLSDQVPDGLQRTDVLVIVAVLFLCDQAADKIPYVDTVWDAAHTVIRPLMGGVVAALLAGDDSSLPQLAAGAAGGAMALVSHLVKAGTRMAVNTSPEPASNIVLSFLEDLVVGTLVVFALFHPVIAAVIVGTLLAVSITVVILLFKRIRRAWRNRKERRAARRGKGTPAPV